MAASNCEEPMTMTPGRRLVYNFMNLPHHKQLEILLHLELTTQMEIAATHGHEAEITLFTEGFKRAKEQSKLEPLTKAIESAVFANRNSTMQFTIHTSQSLWLRRRRNSRSLRTTAMTSGLKSADRMGCGFS